MFLRSVSYADGMLSTEKHSCLFSFCKLYSDSHLYIFSTRPWSVNMKQTQMVTTQTTKKNLSTIVAHFNHSFSSFAKELLIFKAHSLNSFPVDHIDSSRPLLMQFEVEISTRESLAFLLLFDLL